MAKLQAETRKAVAEQAVTKVHGQPTNTDIDLLEEELIAIAATVATALGGGNNGHAGMLLADAEYAALAPGTPFIQPAKPGIYPDGVTNANRARLEAEHKEQVRKFETYVGVAMGLKDLIQSAIDNDYLLELRQERIAYLNVTPMQMITHLRDRWGSVDFVDISALFAACDAPWNVAEVPTIYFNRVEKAVKQLARASIIIDQRAMMNKALKCLKDCGDFEPAIRKWEAKPVVSQTWDNLKRLMTTEYSRAHKQDSTSARATGFASAHNVVEELAEATEEIIANLTKKHAQRIEALVKSNNEILAKLTEAMASKAATAAPTAAATATKEEKRKKWLEKCKNAKICANCNKKHPNRTDDKCWELEVNAASRPAGWTSSKTA
jgi:hypothetical protein